jgi:hypothetical protein
LSVDIARSEAGIAVPGETGNFGVSVKVGVDVGTGVAVDVGFSVIVGSIVIVGSNVAELPPHAVNKVIDNNSDSTAKRVSSLLKTTEI